ncbi:HAD-IC family P-type ATPase [Roseibium sp.]|uniref:HAD-IC family P-type ATPase n=1 Tax=Roseibium sp. TaxID=1936156 RepID=UPI003A97067B
MSSPSPETKTETNAWHELPFEAALRHFNSNQKGLSESEAARALERFGPNALPAPRPKSLLRRFVGQFHNLLIYALIASAAVAFALDHLADSLVIMAVVIANAVIGVIQEGKAENAMASIRKIIAPRATAIREGLRHSIPGKDVVPGDILVLEAGELVPADMRLIEASDLQVQEAILTGESVPVSKRVERSARESVLAERSCMAYSGTLVTRGQGLGVAVATGSESEIGKISGLVGRVQELQTPLIAQMNIFARWLTFLILIFGALLFAYGYWVRHMDPQPLFMAIVGLSVAAIPEGLPAVLTVTLAIGVQAMARRNAIVRRLPAIETLGSVSVICTDKTGTLTFNEMAVTSVVVADHDYSITGQGYAPDGEVIEVATGQKLDRPNHDPVLGELATAARLCNDARLIRDEDDWSVAGDPMEGALLVLAEKTGWREETAQWQRSSVLPFDARHRYMAVLNFSDDPGNAQGLISVKGAPERLLSMCTHVLKEDGTHCPLDQRFWHQKAEALAREGQRVLAFATKSVSRETGQLRQADIEEGLVFLGLVGLMDPPRPEAVASVAACLSAGIRVKMITGDHAGTAAAIGRQIGLLQPDSVLTGADMDLMRDVELRQAVLDTDVFARTSPEHKLRLVEALQAQHLTVAMTGDGVNDSPALKRADAGIAMGLKGSEAARESADLILADDNFRSIADAVREGRTVYDNIVKVIAVTLPTSTGEALTIVAALLLGLTLPMTAAQVLWINLVTASTLGMALAFEPSEAQTMTRPPRSRAHPLLTGQLAWYIALVSGLFMMAVFALFVYATEQGHSVAYARTMSVNALAVLEIFQLLFVRNMHEDRLSLRSFRGTRAVWTTISVVLIAQAAFTYLHPFQQLFDTEALDYRDVALLFGLGAILYGILEIEKRMRSALGAI